ncbi:MAG: phosphatidate cytidylyltransferase [candidate division Zixibacteria bacterium]|nr:phosphatidate cytidylyltransferase [candidate division Zixibacteria bacterium]MDH3937727.1 phosphatidate cytidylyltransferase [candidate division Zixibacteria bacterium]MDH4033740.1 phosphatidate cytidylyltransferase [candidate division Zixibacteria bacterium]
MIDSPDSVPRQITFGQELWRKGTHMFALVIPGGYYFLQLDRVGMLTLMVPITLAFILGDISRLRGWSLWTGGLERFFGRMIRPHEKQGDFSGATYILSTVCFTVALFDKPIAIAAIAFIIVGDTLAALVGRKFGRRRFFGSKSLEGSTACLAGTLIVAVFTPGLALTVAVAGAVVAAVVEALPFGIDDNVTVPILSGLAMTLVTQILLGF